MAALLSNQPILKSGGIDAWIAPTAAGAARPVAAYGRSPCRSCSGATISVADHPPADPAPAGSPPDIVPRLVANAIVESEGWRIVLENKPGASLTLAGVEVLRQPADGYSIYAQALPLSAAPAFLPSMPFNLITDFDPVIRLSASYNVLVVNPSVRANSVAELVALLKSQPDKMSLLFRRRRHARASRRRTVQAADRRARNARALPHQFFQRDCRPAQRHQPIHVHHDACRSWTSSRRESCGHWR